MPKITFYPERKTLNVPAGTTILEAARRADLVIESPCNGVGTCGKCKVKVDREYLINVAAEGRHHLTAEEEREGYLLACEARILDDLKVHLLHRQDEALKILSEGKSFEVHLMPFIRKVFVEAENVTKIYGGQGVLGQETGDTRGIGYGVVVDIGTTTLVAALVDLYTGSEIVSASALNPQAVHAQDVLSRIKFASEENGLELLYRGIIEKINSLIKQITEDAGIESNKIYEIIFSGNTCMLHIATGTNPGSLGKYPYTSLLNGGTYLKASGHHLNISPFGVIYLPPIISAYVGADITSGLVASQLHQKEGTVLFIDIGTNGEMLLSSKGRLSAASTAAGPAFEGINITFGMRAGRGALEYFNVTESGEIELKAIENTEPVGICGSGLLDIVGELVAYGVVDKRGRFADPGNDNLLPELRNRLAEYEGKRAFKITEKVFLTQHDVRQVQLAKGAIRAGIEFLLKSRDIQAENVDRVLIAGSFGYHLRAKSLIHIGLLPEIFKDKIEFLGNTSKSGGRIFLINQDYRALVERIVKEVDILELANFDDFDKVFVKSLGF